MDPLKTFEKRLLSGSLIDTTKIKANRPVWLCPQRVPRLYRDLESMVRVPANSNATGTAGALAAACPLDTGLVYQLLLTSGLPQAVLAALWDQCSRTAPGVLLQHEFYQALALVAICQKGQPPNPALLVSLPQAPLPQLAIAGYPLPLTTPIVSPDAAVEQALHQASAGGASASAASSMLPITNSATVIPNSSSTRHPSTVTQGDPVIYNGATLTASSGSIPLSNGDVKASSTAPRDVDRAGGVQYFSSDNGSACSNLYVTNEIYHGSPVNLTPPQDQQQQQQQLTSAFKEVVARDDRDDNAGGDGDDDDDFGDFADFQSAPVGVSQLLPTLTTKTVETLKQLTAAPTSPLVDGPRTHNAASLESASTFNGGSPNTASDLFSFDPIPNGKVDGSESYQPVAGVDRDRCSTINKQTDETHERKENNAFVSVPKAKPSGAVLKPATSTIFPSVIPSLFDSITVQMTETVQPPSDPNPWLHYPFEQETLSFAGQDRRPKTNDTARKQRTVRPLPKSIDSQTVTAPPAGGLLNRGISMDDDEFDEFADFQSAPSENATENGMNHTLEEQARKTEQISDASTTTDKYSAFRMLEPGQPQSNANELDNDVQQNETRLTNGGTTETAVVDTSPKVDILALMKLPSMPTINLDDDLSLLDSLIISANDGADTKGSAIEELQDLDLGYSVVDGPVATDESTVNSTQVSPSKSLVSNGSIGEPRGEERRLSLFNNRANYSECASLSSFELGPNTESNGSSPTKGSILSLELNSPKRSPPEETIDEDDTLVWTLDGSSTEQRDDESPSNSHLEITAAQTEKAKSPEEFCWAQPPMFPPPDPTTDFSKPSSTLQDLTELYLNNYPNAQVQEGKKHLTKEQVAESWIRILGKVTAVLETATHILGNDRGVLTEVLATSKGQGYISSLLEVYNVSQQIKKAASLSNVDGLTGPLEQVENAWRRQLEDLTVRLGLSVICLDHLLSPLQSSADTCAVCLLPLALRPRLLFGDHAYHATCANFWANVLAEGLPCLKLD